MHRRNKNFRLSFKPFSFFRLLLSQLNFRTIMKSKLFLKSLFIAAFISIFSLSTAFAQYNQCAGTSQLSSKVQVRKLKKGVSSENAKNMADDEAYDYKYIESDTYEKNKEQYKSYEKVASGKIDADKYGNASGSEFDLAKDGAFKGQTIAVLHFYTGGGFDFSLPKEALMQKGFSIHRWMNEAPSPKELKKVLDKSCQLWIISSNVQKLNKEHLEVIKEFYNSGKGLYIWGDNNPYYADANFVAEGIFGVKMNGNLAGGKTVGLQQQQHKAGILKNHLISTGMEYVFEGITIATIETNPEWQPLIYGSANNVVTAFYEKDGKRAIIDGGFTRLYCNWKTAGTGRYVKNAAAWLVNAEKFKDTVAKK